MKYVVDMDALFECFDCLHSISVNGGHYVSLDLAKEFICRFPKTPVEAEYYELKLAKEESEDDNQGSEEEV